ncbi:MAG: hypothetical protein J6V13_06250 [Paludibacteraceae bacterium]|nr:hypothetical protein [Paludibacteraceae bacterium]
MKQGFLNNHAWIDLGLSVKWATCNIGTDKPEQIGKHYAWGEMQDKSPHLYTLDHYQYTGDVVSMLWGEGWRLPTLKEQEELLNKCEWIWTRNEYSCGFTIIGPNHNSIFLPAAGLHCGKGLVALSQQGTYWSETLLQADNSYAYYLHFTPGERKWKISRYFYGRSIRPVCV